ncbi:MAG: VOC family protein [Rhodospirillaceae bacterium]|nr:VOC family protein [Rhodospirillaceae bacterium]
MRPVVGIDHVLAGVVDLEAARTAWQRLGFTVTPRGRHIGWGTGNYCIMFPSDYVELLGIVDPTGDLQGLDRLLADREGLLGLAFATRDAEAVYAQLRRAGLAGEPPADLSRLLEAPEGTVEPAFKLVHPTDPVALFGFKIFVCQHLTPDLVWRRDWVTHPNGATRILAVTAATPDTTAVAPAYRALLGNDAVVQDSAGLSVLLGSSILRLAESDDIAGLIGMAVAVSDLERARRLLAGGGIAYEADADGLHIDPDCANGVALSLVER